MHCPPPPTLEVLESVLAKRGLGLRRELVTPSVRTQQCSLSRDQRRCATCAMRAALAVCERFQHESSSPCYRSSGGWVECSRLSESAASCGATSSADTTSSSPGSRYRAALLHGPEQIADLPVPVVESPGAVRIGHPKRGHLVEYLAPNSVFNSLPRQRSCPHLGPDDRFVTIDRVLHHASLGAA